MPKYLTISYPLDESPDGYLFKCETITSKAIQANLLLLLTTEVGTRYYQPDYGCDLRPVLFELNDENINDIIKNIIEAAVNKFMPEITIEKVNFYTYENELNSRYIDINYTYQINTYTETNTLSLRFQN